ncbi:MAG: AAA family ATPase [Negativicutes bacterium]|nr:AAA family ATPase [Negativicutes bacterium]
MIKARYPLLYVPSWEEKRIVDTIQEVASNGPIAKVVYTWTVATGLYRRGLAAVPNTVEPLAALEFVEKFNRPAIFCFLDFHPFLESRNVTVRKLKNLAGVIKQDFKTIILISPTLTIPVELQKVVTVVDFLLPGEEEINTLLDTVVQEQGEHQYKVNLSGAEREKLVKAAQGLTLDEIENAFSKAVVTDGVLDAADIDLILEEKRQVIRKTGILDYYPVTEGMEVVGGLGALKEWLRKRGRSFTDEAKAFGLPAPKGVLVTGIPGCGKSLCAKAASALWQLPLLRLDMGKIFAGIVGSSEENMRKAIQTAEAIAPCILWIDEIEKGLAGTGGSGDSGVSARVFGTFLTWMQEKTTAVFVFATANAIEKLPPELLRKGRFDEIFFVDLPQPQERMDIFQIHLSKRRKKISEFDLRALSDASEGYSGSEIEQAVITGMVEAFDANRQLDQQDLLAGIKKTVPLSRTMSEYMQALHLWAEERAVMAALPEQPLQELEMAAEIFPLTEAEDSAARQGCLATTAAPVLALTEEPKDVRESSEAEEKKKAKPGD